MPAALRGEKKRGEAFGSMGMCHSNKSALAAGTEHRAVLWLPIARPLALDPDHRRQGEWSRTISNIFTLEDGQQ
jgi:hypothetical protein